MTIITVLTVFYAVVYDWAHSTVNDIYHSGTQHTPSNCSLAICA